MDKSIGSLSKKTVAIKNVSVLMLLSTDEKAMKKNNGQRAKLDILEL